MLSLLEEEKNQGSIPSCMVSSCGRAGQANQYDECGNQWECSSLFGRRPFLHFIIGGGFNRLVMARRLCEGSHVMVGAPVALCF